MVTKSALYHIGFRDGLGKVKRLRTNDLTQLQNGRLTLTLAEDLFRTGSWMEVLGA